jgi:DNA-binding NtrC family response regulator
MRNQSADLKVKQQYRKRISRPSQPRDPEPSIGPKLSPTAPKRPTVVMFTRDVSLQQLFSNICAASCTVESNSDPSFARTLVLDRNVRMAVIDDEVVPTSERAWLCSQINKLAPKAALIYVASQHSAEVEKTARAHGAMYYTAKPLEADRLGSILQAWLKRSLD